MPETVSHFRQEGIETRVVTKLYGRVLLVPVINKVKWWKAKAGCHLCYTRQATFTISDHSMLVGGHVPRSRFHFVSPSVCPCYSYIGRQEERVVMRKRVLKSSATLLALCFNWWHLVWLWQGRGHYKYHLLQATSLVWTKSEHLGLFAEVMLHVPRPLIGCGLVCGRYATVCQLLLCH